MREILFRGYFLDSSIWFYGLPIVFKDIELFAIQTFDGAIFRVKPDSIGQYTGLTDKNGTKIFEGDIVEFESHGYIPFKQRGVVVFKDYLFCISYDYYGPRFQNFIKSEIVDDGPASIPVTYTFEVIGNIHDNPELLKGCEE